MEQKSIWRKPQFVIPIAIFGILVISFVIRITVIIIEPYLAETEYKTCLQVCESDESLKKMNKNLEKFNFSKTIDSQECIDSCNKEYESNKKYFLKKSLQQEIEKGNKWKVLKWIIFGFGS